MIETDKEYADIVLKKVSDLNIAIINKVKEDIDFSRKFFDNLTKGADIKENFKLLKKYF